MCLQNRVHLWPLGCSHGEITSTWGDGFPQVLCSMKYTILLICFIILILCVVYKQNTVFKPKKRFLIFTQTFQNITNTVITWQFLGKNLILALLGPACCHQYRDIRRPLMLLGETSAMRWNVWKRSPRAPHSIRTAKSAVETTSANHRGAHMRALSLKHKKAGTNRKQ